MKKFKKLLISLGLGAMLVFGAASAVSAETMGKLEGDVIPESSAAITLEDYDVPSGSVLPTPPTTSVKQTASSLTSVSLSWGKASGANGYRVYIGPRNATSGFKSLGITKKNSCKITQLLPGTPYTIRLQSVKLNSSGKVVDAADKYLRFNIATKVPAVNRISTDSKGKFTIRMYNPSPSDKSDDIVGYKVIFTNLQKGSTATKYFNTRTGFTYIPRENTFYKLTIRPYITVKGEKNYCSSSLTQYIAQQPKLSKRGHTSTSQTISWKRVYGADAYNIYVKYPGSSSYKRVKRTAGLSYTLTGMKKGQDYQIKVVAYRGKAPSASSTYYRIRL